jgi:hypothetical protein
VEAMLPGVTAVRLGALVTTEIVGGAGTRRRHCGFS